MTPRFYNFDIPTCIHFHLNMNPLSSTSNNNNEEFIDDGEQMLDNEVDETNSNVGPEKRRGRGKDLEWRELAKFDTVDDYKNSEVFQEIKQDFSRRKTGEVYGASREVFYCKFLRKLKFKPCYRKIRVSFSQSSDEV